MSNEMTSELSLSIRDQVVRVIRVICLGSTKRDKQTGFDCAPELFNQRVLIAEVRSCFQARHLFTRLPIRSSDHWNGE